MLCIHCALILLYNWSIVVVLVWPIQYNNSLWWVFIEHKFFRSAFKLWNRWWAIGFYCHVFDMCFVCCGFLYFSMTMINNVVSDLFLPFLTWSFLRNPFLRWLMRCGCGSIMYCQLHAILQLVETWNVSFRCDFIWAYTLMYLNFLYPINWLKFSLSACNVYCFPFRLLLASGWFLTLVVFATSLLWSTPVSPFAVLFLCQLPMPFMVLSLIWYLLWFFPVVLLSLSVPLVYDKFQDRIDEKLIIAYKAIQIQYKKIDDLILRKLPMLNKGKKTQ